MASVLAQNIEKAIAVFESLARLDLQIQSASRLIADALMSGHKLLVCGNGGSAAEAAHLTTEFVCRFDRDRRPYPAICLSVHAGDITAIGNDYNFEDLFARQVEAFSQPGDLLIVFSTSGRSANIRRALESAKRREVKSISFLGRDGGPCAGMASVELIVANDQTARIQEGHQLLFHTICELVEQELS